MGGDYPVDIGEGEVVVNTHERSNVEMTLRLIRAFARGLHEQYPCDQPEAPSVSNKADESNMSVFYHKAQPLVGYQATVFLIHC